MIRRSGEVMLCRHCGQLLPVVTVDGQPTIDTFRFLAVHGPCLDRVQSRRVVVGHRPAVRS